MAEIIDQVTIAIGDKDYVIPLPINLDIALRAADAIEAFGRAQERVNSRQGTWRAVMDKYAAAAAIISFCLSAQHPEVTTQFIRSKVAPTTATGAENPAAVALMRAAGQISTASGFFSDEDVKRSDALRAEATRGEAEPTPAGQD
jgi:hypothetical protein